MAYAKERRRILDTCLELETMGYFLGTWGNVSMRAGNHILLTPSRVNYRTMQPDDIVVIDMEGNRVEGERTPTSEKEVHRLIYRQREDINAIVHCHSLHATAAACAGLNEVPPLMEEMSQLLGGAIPVTAQYVAAERHHELGTAAAAAIGDRSAVLLRNHGPVCCGRDMDEALLVCRVAEKACQIFLLVSPELKPERIDEASVQSERYRYLYKYGRENT